MLKTPSRDIQYRLPDSEEAVYVFILGKKSFKDEYYYSEVIKSVKYNSSKIKALKEVLDTFFDIKQKYQSPHLSIKLQIFSEVNDNPHLRTVFLLAVVRCHHEEPRLEDLRVALADIARHSPVSKNLRKYLQVPDNGIITMHSKLFRKFRDHAASLHILDFHHLVEYAASHGKKSEKHTHSRRFDDLPQWMTGAVILGQDPMHRYVTTPFLSELANVGLYGRTTKALQGLLQAGFFDQPTLIFSSQPADFEGLVEKGIVHRVVRLTSLGLNLLDFIKSKDHRYLAIVVLFFRKLNLLVTGDTGRYENTRMERLLSTFDWVKDQTQQLDGVSQGFESLKQVFENVELLNAVDQTRNFLQSFHKDFHQIIDSPIFNINKYELLQSPGILVVDTTDLSDIESIGFALLMHLLGEYNYHEYTVVFPTSSYLEQKGKSMLEQYVFTKALFQFNAVASFSPFYWDLSLVFKGRERNDSDALYSSRYPEYLDVGVLAITQNYQPTVITHHSFGILPFATPLAFEDYSSHFSRFDDDDGGDLDTDDHSYQPDEDFKQVPQDDRNIPDMLNREYFQWYLLASMELGEDYAKDYFYQLGEAEFIRMETVDEYLDELVEVLKVSEYKEYYHINQEYAYRELQLAHQIMKDPSYWLKQRFRKEQPSPATLAAELQQRITLMKTAADLQAYVNDVYFFIFNFAPNEILKRKLLACTVLIRQNSEVINESRTARMNVHEHLEELWELHKEHQEQKYKVFEPGTINEEFFATYTEIAMDMPLEESEDVNPLVLEESAETADPEDLSIESSTEIQDDPIESSDQSTDQSTDQDQVAVDIRDIVTIQEAVEHESITNEIGQSKVEEITNAWAEHTSIDKVTEANGLLAEVEDDQSIEPELQEKPVVDNSWVFSVVEEESNEVAISSESEDVSENIQQDKSGEQLSEPLIVPGNDQVHASLPLQWSPDIIGNLVETEVSLAQRADALEKKRVDHRSQWMQIHQLRFNQTTGKYERTKPKVKKSSPLPKTADGAPPSAPKVTPALPNFVVENRRIVNRPQAKSADTEAVATEVVDPESITTHTDELIEATDLSSRIKSALLEAKLTQVKELKQRLSQDPQGLLQVPGIGEKSLNTLIECFQQPADPIDSSVDTSSMGELEHSIPSEVIDQVRTSFEQIPELHPQSIMQDILVQGLVHPITQLDGSSIPYARLVEAITKTSSIANVSTRDFFSESSRLMGYYERLGSNHFQARTIRKEVVSMLLKALVNFKYDTSFATILTNEIRNLQDLH